MRSFVPLGDLVTGTHTTSRFAYTQDMIMRLCGLFLTAILITQFFFASQAVGQTANAPDQPCSGLAEAQSRLESGDFCGAFELVCPLLETCPEQGDTISMAYRISQANCPKYKNLIVCPGQTSAGAASLPVSEATPSPQPANIKNGGIGFFPLQFEDVSGQLRSTVNPMDIVDGLAEELAWTSITPVESGLVTPWVDKHDLRDLTNFLVHPSTIKLDAVSKDAVVGGPPPKYVNAMVDLCSQAGVRYMLFTKLTRKSGEDDFALWFCMFDCANPKKPVLDEEWNKITQVRHIPKRAVRMGEIITEELGP